MDLKKISQIYGQDVYKLVDNVDKLKLLLAISDLSRTLSKIIFLVILPSKKSKILKQELEEMSPQPRTKVEEGNPPFLDDHPKTSQKWDYSAY